MVDILVKQVRWDKKMTLKQLSKLSGVSSSSINNIENGIKVPRIDTLCYIARGLGVPVTDLFVDTKGRY